jgi:2-desacetyl-2-hydroxyethyl bacteriochlorophyllide A dehydrogenase
MQQIVLETPGKFIAREIDDVVASPGEALVRIARIGVCGTDLHAFAGRQPFFNYPRVLGHELGVEIVAVPANDRGLAAADRCAVEPYFACGRCRPCGLGKYNCCESLKVLGVHCDGGMQTHFSVPLHLLHKSARLSLDELALVETLGIGAHAVERADVQAGERVLVVGAGPIGLAVIQFAVAAGASVTVLDVSRERREFASQLSVETIDSAVGKTFEIVFDATGNRAAMEASQTLVAFAGKLVLVGIVQDKIAIDDPLFHRREMTLLASRNSAGLFPKIIRMIETGQIDTRPWITHRLALSSVPEEFPSLPGRANLVKAMIEVE